MLKKSKMIHTARFSGFVCLFGVLLAACVGSHSALLKKIDRKIVSQPVLRVETGMHIGSINKLDVDAAQKILVTCSNDKTVRVWDIKSGDLLRVIRVPIGDGKFGVLYAVAISPDGRTIATGGYGRKTGIYIIDRASGAIRHRIGNLEGSIWSLAFSRDGRYLAAGVFKRGLRVFNTSNWKKTASRGTYNRESTAWVDFAGDGRLVTASRDGYIRLYSADFKKTIAKRKMTVSKKLSCVKFSPDGQKIAVAFLDSAAIQVLSAADFSLLYLPDASGVTDGNPGYIAWSADGNQLMAFGRWWQKEKKTPDVPIRIWNNAGEGGYKDVYVASTTIRGVVGMKNGDILYGSMEPAWGMYNTEGQEKLRVEVQGIDFHGGSRIKNFFKTFKVSHDGAQIGGVLNKKPGEMIFFDVSQRILSRMLETAQSNLAGPATMSKGLKITDYSRNRSPKLNGNTLLTVVGEMSRSVSIAPDSKQFVLGTDRYLRCFNRLGTQKWKEGINSSAWHVNISGNGRLVVAALTDGTIRWFRLSDGEPILTLFIHKDGKRWVAWTSSGYYAASPGAEDLIGWHVNRGKDRAADFFPASRFRAAKYRPDVVEEILIALDEKKALARADSRSGRKPAPEADVERQLPPIVNIQSPNHNSRFSTDKVQVSFSVRSMAPLTGFKVLVNGRPVPITDEEKREVLAASNKVVSIPVPPEDVRISIIAENRHAAGTPATVRLKWHQIQAAVAPVSPAANAQDDNTPISLKEIQLYLQKLGYNPGAIDNKMGNKTKAAIRKFQQDKNLAVDGKPSQYLLSYLKVYLNGSTADSQDLKSRSSQKVDPEPAGLKPKLFILAVGASKYRDAALELAYPVKDARDFAKVMTAQKGLLYSEVVIKLMENPDKDTVFAGLEWLERETTSRDVAILFLAGHGINDRNNNYYFLPVEGDPDSLKRTGVPYHEIKNTIVNLPGKVVAFIDTCHAGGVMGRRLRGVYTDIDRIANDLSAAENGVVVFTSSTGRQNSIEDERWQNGAFTKALVEGLSGKADINTNRAITITELDYYLSERVKVLTKGKQTPATAKPSTIQDFPIAVKMGD